MSEDHKPEQSEAPQDEARPEENQSAAPPDEAEAASTAPTEQPQDEAPSMSEQPPESEDTPSGAGPTSAPDDAAEQGQGTATGDRAELRDEALVSLPRTGNGWRDNLIKRFAFGLPAFVLLLLLIALLPRLLLALVVLAAGVFGMYEYVQLLAGVPRIHLPHRPLLLGAVLIGLGGLVGTTAGLSGMTLLAVLIALGAVLFGEAPRSVDGLYRAGLAMLGLVAVAWFINHLSLLLALSQGRGLVLLLVLALTLNDTLAYLVGSLLGRRKLMPTVSPNKTVEGALGGLVGGAVAGLLAAAWLAGIGAAFTVTGAVLLGVVVAVAGQAGDLLESKLKRLTGAEDSGSFLPGHGGFLDRLDAYLVATPVLYYIAVLVGA